MIEKEAAVPSILMSTQNTRPILPDSLRFLRSDAPRALTREETEWLLAERILTVVDLREEGERAAGPCPLERDGRFRYLCLPVTGGGRIPASPEEVVHTYLNMVDDQMERILAAIWSARTNVLYFCNAGKDRTGVVSALLLRRLGTDREHIVSDYMRSRENLLPALSAFAAAHPEIDPRVILPRRSYMEEFLDEMDRRDGAEIGFANP